MLPVVVDAASSSYFCRLPRDGALTRGLVTAQQTFLVSPLREETGGDAAHYLLWRGELSRSEAVEVSPQVARQLGVESHESVRLTAVQVGVAMEVELEPKSQADWAAICEHAGVLEERLLEQLGLVYLDQELSLSVGTALAVSVAVRGVRLRGDSPAAPPTPDPSTETKELPTSSWISRAWSLLVPSSGAGSSSNYAACLPGVGRLASTTLVTVAPFKEPSLPKHHQDIDFHNLMNDSDFCASSRQELRVLPLVFWDLSTAYRLLPEQMSDSEAASNVDDDEMLAEQGIVESTQLLVCQVHSLYFFNAVTQHLAAIGQLSDESLDDATLAVTGNRTILAVVRRGSAPQREGQPEPFTKALVVSLQPSRHIRPGFLKMPRCLLVALGMTGHDIIEVELIPSTAPLTMPAQITLAPLLWRENDKTLFSDMLTDSCDKEYSILDQILVKLVDSLMPSQFGHHESAVLSEGMVITLPINCRDQEIEHIDFVLRLHPSSGYVQHAMLPP